MGVTGTWATNTPAVAGTYVVDGKKPGNDNRFYKLGTGVYMHRKGNSSWTEGSGMKLSNGQGNGVAVFLSSAMKFSGLVKKKSDKNAASVTFNVYTISNGSATFDALEAGTDNSTEVTITTAAEPTYSVSTSFAALDSKAAEEKSTDDLTIAAGYSYIVGAETTTAGSLFLYSVTFTSAASYTVTYQPGEATGDDVIDNAASTVADCPNTWEAPEGKGFTGWQDGMGTPYAVGATVTGNLTLIAQWASLYTVSFNLQGHGEAIDNQSVISGGKVEEPAAPSASGWTFGGWYKEAECTHSWDFDTDVITSATTLYATWTEVQAPTYGNLFSLSGIGSGYSNSSGAETELTNVTISGGHSYGYGDSSKTISYSSNKIKYGGGINYIKLVLDNSLQVGDVISFTCDANTGLNFNSDGSAAGGNTSYATGALNGSTYTVEENDGLVGENTIYCWRRTGNGTNVSSITINRPASITIADLSAIDGSTYTGKNYATLYYSDVAIAVPAGVKAYTFKQEDDKLVVSRTYENGGTYPVIPAGEAVVVESEAGATYKFNISTTATTVDENSLLEGTDASTTIDETGYKYYKLAMNDALTSVGFYFAEDGGASITNGAHKAYLRLSTGGSAKSFFVLDGEGAEEPQNETDGINTVNGSGFTVNGEAYNLAGQKVDVAFKGIVIVNGKKMLNK